EVIAQRAAAHGQHLVLGVGRAGLGGAVGGQAVPVAGGGVQAPALAAGGGRHRVRHAVGVGVAERPAAEGGQLGQAVVAGGGAVGVVQFVEAVVEFVGAVQPAAVPVIAVLKAVGVHRAAAVDRDLPDLVGDAAEAVQAVVLVVGVAARLTG